MCRRMVSNFVPYEPAMRMRERAGRRSDVVLVLLGRKDLEGDAALDATAEGGPGDVRAEAGFVCSRGLRVMDWISFPK